MNYFCDLDTIVNDCQIRGTLPRICCCFCPYKIDCHKKQRKDLQNHTSSVIMPCIVNNEEIDHCRECEHQI